MSRKLHKQRYKLFLTHLREARERAGFTQAGAAEALAETQSFVSKVERGERRLDVVDLIDFLQVYAISPSTFMKQLADLLESPPTGAASQSRPPRKKRS